MEDIFYLYAMSTFLLIFCQMHISQQVHDPILWSMIHTPFVYKTTQQKCTVCLMLTDTKEFNNLFWSGIAKTNVYVSKMNEKT